MKGASAIVLAAGKGERFASSVPKLLVKTGGYPILYYCLETMSRHPLIDEIILVVNSQVKERVTGIIKQYRIKKVSRIVLGGTRRQDSVNNGLKAMSARNDLVLIHDAARPFVDKKTITLALKEAAVSGAVVVAVPVKATIKEVTGSPVVVKKTLNRDILWEMQTPQVFKKELILEAYKKFGSRKVTDDAALVEKLGAKVRLVRGSYFNIKITTPEDLILARHIKYAI